MGSSFPITSGLLGEHINRSPEESDFALIGRIALQHTGLEYQLETLVWYYMEDVDKGHIATARLGAVEKTDMLATFVEWTEPDDGIAEVLSWVIKCFHILRLNRNSVIHGFNFRADRRAKKLIIERRTKSLVFDAFQTFEISRDILRQVSTDQTALAMFIFKLNNIVQERPKGSIGPNLPTPSNLVDYHQNPPNQRLYPHFSMKVPKVLDSSGGRTPRQQQNRPRLEGRTSSEVPRETTKETRGRKSRRPFPQYATERRAACVRLRPLPHPATRPRRSVEALPFFQAAPHGA